MSGHKGHLRWLAAVLCCAVPVASFADVKDDLQKRGIRISTTAATVTGENEVASQLKDIPNLRRKLFQATSQLDDHKKTGDQLDGQIAKLNQQLVGLNAQLANVQDAVTNNRLIGAIGTVEGQLRLLYENRDKRTKQEASINEQVSSARDALISRVVEIRKTADDVSRQYWAAEKETQELISQYNKEKNANVTFQPSSVYLANLRKLDDLEGDILEEDIKLRRDGNTYWASVKLNGDHTVEMVVDSGAAIVLLPYEDAVKAGIKPGESAPQVRLGVADGRTTTGRLMTIKSLQLGKFTANDVECVVLSPDAGRAAPLLGMTFLGKFKFQLDAGKSELSLVRVRGANSASDKPTKTSRLPPVQMLRGDWKLVPTAADAQYWTDRDNKIDKLPRELNGSSFVLRKVDDRDWPSGEMIANEPVKVTVAIRSSWYNGKTRKLVEDFDDEMLATLKTQGWSVIEGFASCPDKDRLKWKWVTVEKKFEPGPIRIPSPVSHEDTVEIFFVEPTGG